MTEQTFVKKIIVCFLIAPIVIVQSAAAQTTFHGNIARTGVYDSPGLEQLNGVKWAFKTEGPIASSAAVANGLVYFSGNDGVSGRGAGFASDRR